ncbi:asparagine synthase (glutamine-hydrolyzing) [Cenarchaeum symbiosum A]|uniref:Asparagine synthase (Glutamine-hydrolyzing) n=1 Tax=Cenarchaeum symbiosum (strain A) TaxID=414004 RepID=A0RUC0_CENSY|nr:asparagine synthase (glutamine-hydrolyzing) [Cenarchaeum symbiosum A]
MFDMRSSLILWVPASFLASMARSAGMRVLDSISAGSSNDSTMPSCDLKHASPPGQAKLGYYNSAKGAAAMESMMARLRDELRAAVRACGSKNLALSGGLDSTVIACLLGEGAEAAAVIADDFVGTDLAYHQMAAAMMGAPPRIIRATTPEILDAIEGTIRVLGSFNDIEIRNSAAMYLLIERVAGTGWTSMITGDGADELFAGYDFFGRLGPAEIEEEQQRILGVMHFDSHRIGKALGVRIESPFLAPKVAEIARSVPAEYKVREEGGRTYGKWILRKAFEDAIPRAIAWRPKAALQDGSGTAGLTGLFESVVSDGTFESKRGAIEASDGIRVRSKESLHYYEAYRRIFGKPEPPAGGRPCPYCRHPVPDGYKFCAMCGAYPA